MMRDKQNKNKYDVSNENRHTYSYGDYSFGDGGNFDKTKNIIVKKIGLSEQNADYLIGVSKKFAVWLADSIVKDEIDYKKMRNDDYGEQQADATIKEFALNRLNKAVGSNVRNNYGGGIREILDWLQHPLTPSQNLRELSFQQALDNARIFHEELKVLGGDIDYVEPEENTILKQYKDGDTTFYWVYIPSNFCSLESSRMGHCGRTGHSNQLISLRSVKPYGKGHTINDSHVTIAYGVNDKLFYQSKGKKNQKPSEKYLDYIFDLIESMIKSELIVGDDGEAIVLDFNGFGSEYESKEDYGFGDMTKEQIERLYEIKPEIFDGIVGEITLYNAGVITEKPNTKFILECNASYVETYLDIDRDIRSDIVESVLSGDASDLHSYYYRYNDEIIRYHLGDIDKENEKVIIQKISEITGLAFDVIAQNGIEYYLSGDYENEVDDEKEYDFDEIFRAINEALNYAEGDDTYIYYRDGIKEALEEYGNVISLNDEGMKIEIDLLNGLSLSQIQAHIAETNSNQLEDIFNQALYEGDIDKPNLSFDGRWSPTADDKLFNEFLADNLMQFKKGGSITSSDICWYTNTNYWFTKFMF